MALMHSPQTELGFLAPDFHLRGVDEKIYTLKSFTTYKALLVVFMCNHCPYVIAVQERLNALAKKFGPLGLGMIGINSNDPQYRSEDSFENMQIRAKELGYVFPYVIDETQDTARAYNAVCTPDPFLFVHQGAGQFALSYRGRIDDSWKDPSQIKEESLSLAIECALSGKPYGNPVVSSMGCSIKWKSQS